MICARWIIMVSFVSRSKWVTLHLVAHIGPLPPKVPRCLLDHLCMALWAAPLSFGTLPSSSFFKHLLPHSNEEVFWVSLALAELKQITLRHSNLSILVIHRPNCLQDSDALKSLLTSMFVYECHLFLPTMGAMIGVNKSCCAPSLLAPSAVTRRAANNRRAVRKGVSGWLNRLPVGGPSDHSALTLSLSLPSIQCLLPKWTWQSSLLSSNRLFLVSSLPCVDFLKIANDTRQLEGVTAY